MLFNYSNKYGLHDTTVNKITLQKNSLILTFNDGVYQLNGQGQEVQLVSTCKMLIEIAEFDSNKLYEHIEIIKLYHGKYGEVPFQKFIRSVESNGFEIDLDYHCSFSNSLLFKGYLAKNQIEFIISEITNLQFEIVS